MNFSELEALMSSRGVNTLAEIARTLDTTPQAVSNWKARNQVPYHIVAKINESKPSVDATKINSPQFYRGDISENNGIGLSDLLLTLASQVKIIVLVTFTFVFTAFTYIKLIEKPTYVSSSVLLLSDNSDNIGGLSSVSSLASRFGVNLSQSTAVDLSSPSLLPDLVRSRTFAERMLEKSFYTNKYSKNLPLLSILTQGASQSTVGRDTLIESGIIRFNQMISFNNDGSFSVLTVEADEPKFARDLNIEILDELLKLNSFFKNQKVNETINFIENRITSVNDDLSESEQNLKLFNEKNRQISSPKLLLEQERLQREVEVQENVFLTLKQQLELAKIELVQKGSIVQILDEPRVPITGNKSRLIINVLAAFFVGFSLSIIISYLRYRIINADLDERKKIRRIKNFFIKKSKDLFFDYRVTGIISVLLLVGLPFYLGHTSTNPIFFNKYSYTLMTVILVYILTLVIFLTLFLINLRKK